MVHTLWLGLMELPVKAPDKDWDMQVRTRTARLNKLCTLWAGAAPASRQLLWGPIGTQHGPHCS